MAKAQLWTLRVNYAAVGATQAADLMQYPPPGFRPFEKRVRIGHGPARFDYAWHAALSWGIQTNSGFAVDVEATPDEVTDLTYTPVVFDEAGVPVEAASIDGAEEATFGPDGTEFVTPGTTATLTMKVGPVPFHAPCRVVYVIDEPKRKGFAYGTLAGHPECGEESFVVDQTDDGSVWLTIRTFSRPSRWFWWASYPVLRLLQGVYTRRYFRALTGPVD